MSRELRIRYKNVGFVAKMSKQSLKFVHYTCAITDCADTFDSERARSQSLGEETSMKANSDKSKQSKKRRAVYWQAFCAEPPF